MTKKTIHVHIPEVPVTDDIKTAFTPGTTKRVMDEIQEEMQDFTETDLEDEVDVEVEHDGEIEVIPIQLSLALNAPIDTVTEKQKLYVITKNIMLQLIKKSKPGKPHPQLLGYIRESSSQLDSIHKMTEGVQQEESIEKLKVIRAMFQANPDLSEEFKIQFLKQMRNKQLARENEQKQG